MYVPSGKIYAIRNDINNRVYVGQTRKSLKQRFENHLRSLNDGSPIHRAMKIYGPEHFWIELLEECPVERLDAAESAWIMMKQAYVKGYNASLGGLGRQTYLYDIIWDVLQQGKTVHEVCDLVGCGKDVVYKVAKLHNYKPKTPRDTRKIAYAVEGVEKNGARHYFANPQKAAEWCIRRELTKSTDVHNASMPIRRCCSGQRKTAHGMEWKYISV